MRKVEFLHTLTAGYTTGAMFVLGISAFYLLKGRDIGFAKRSFSVAATFGFIAASAVLIMGMNQVMKLVKHNL